MPTGPDVSCVGSLRNASTDTMTKVADAISATQSRLRPGRVWRSWRRAGQTLAIRAPRGRGASRRRHAAREQARPVSSSAARSEEPATSGIAPAPIREQQHATRPHPAAMAPSGSLDAVRVRLQHARQKGRGELRCSPCSVHADTASETRRRRAQGRVRATRAVTVGECQRRQSTTSAGRRPSRRRMRLRRAPQTARHRVTAPRPRAGTSAEPLADGNPRASSVPTSRPRCSTPNRKNNAASSTADTIRKKLK